MQYYIELQTKRFLGKPLFENFIGSWKSEDEVRQVISRERPKAEILKIEEWGVQNS